MKRAAISHEEALAVLDEAERVGLVHTVSNVASGIGYVCNCCGCCCGLLRGINEWGIEHSVAQANYFAEIDPRHVHGLRRLRRALPGRRHRRETTTACASCAASRASAAASA